MKIEQVCTVKLELMEKKERKSVMEKLHRQFVHPGKKRLIALMTDAGIWRSEYEEELDDLYEKCHTCKLYKRTPPKPVVSLPMAQHFNEKLAMDLKLWKKGRNILHMVDIVVFRWLYSEPGSKQCFTGSDIHRVLQEVTYIVFYRK